MQQLSAAGQKLVDQLAQKHGFSPDAIAHMLFAVCNGNGAMAQFNHSEFGGGGQWMQGGMIMLGDMFNNYLKGRVDQLCNDLSSRLANEPGLLRSGSFQSQSQQSGTDVQQQNTGGSTGNNPLFVPNPDDLWWPADLGQPSASGSQNQMRYAYFQDKQRLAVKTGSQVWVYDTQQHQIGGFSQQNNSGIAFTSQFGTVNLSQLPIVMRDGQPVSPNTSLPQNPSSSPSSDDIFQKIERLGQLRDKGMLSDEDFNQKKNELLSRL